VTEPRLLSKERLEAILDSVLLPDDLDLELEGHIQALQQQRDAKVLALESIQELLWNITVQRDKLVEMLEEVATEFCDDEEEVCHLCGTSLSDHDTECVVVKANQLLEEVKGE